ncbi:MAG: tetratricopeptide repeat protein [Prevotella sp.]|nr:tetratricopeptide repeat protein [Prevotella sp.]
MDLAALIEHPERMDRETLYELRSILAQYPYYQPARLLLLQNLFLLHDPTFDEELQRAAIYITDRRKLFQLVEGIHYQILRGKEQEVRGKEHGAVSKDSRLSPQTPSLEGRAGERLPRPSTLDLINNFLDSIPADYQEEKPKKRKPSPADATIDYVSYLLDIEEQEKNEKKDDVPQLKGQSLIDDFIYNEGGNFNLKEEPEFLPDLDAEGEQDAENDEGYFTETLARIYIKQGRYSKALEIIQRLNLVYPKKSRYFADQIRFLEKLIENNNKKQIKK